MNQEFVLKVREVKIYTKKLTQERRWKYLGLVSYLSNCMEEASIFCNSCVLEMLADGSLFMDQDSYVWSL